MSTSFQDRLNRIRTNGQSIAVPQGHKIDLIGASGADEPLPDCYSHAPKTYDQKFNMTIMNNLILGCIWMAITGYVAVNFTSVIKGFIGRDATAETLFNMQIGLGVALAVSSFLFYWVVREAIRDLGKLHGMPASLAIGGVIGVVIGAGPITVFKALEQIGYL